MQPLPTCPQCGYVMDDHAQTLLAHESLSDEALCLGCLYESQFGTRRPSPEQLAAAGWPRRGRRPPMTPDLEDR